MTCSTTLRALIMMATIGAGTAAPAQQLSPNASPSAPTRAPSTTSPLPGNTAGNPKGSTILTGTVQPPKFVSYPLTVRFLTDSNNPVTLVAAGMTFRCAPEPGNPTPVTACTAQANGRYVDLSASYGKTTPLFPIAAKVSGNQWKQACAGTVGDSCRVAMTGPQTVGIDFYAKP